MEGSATRRPVHVTVLSKHEVVTRGVTAMLADVPDRVVVSRLPGAWSQAAGVDVVVYDAYNLFHHDGADLTHLVRDTAARVLVLSRDTHPELRARAARMGATHWVSMSAHLEELLEAVERCASGQEAADHEDWTGQHTGLSARQAQILGLITEGLSNADISARVPCSPNTLKTHIRGIYRRIGVATRSEAVAWALLNGFAPAETEPPGTAGRADPPMAADGSGTAAT